MTLGSYHMDYFDSEFVFSVVVDAPSLVYFKLYGIAVQSFSFLNPMSLVEADFTDLFDNRGNRLVDKDIGTNLLRVISNVQSLYFTDDILKVFSLFDKDKPQLVFHNLVHLEIGYNPGFRDFDGGLAELLESAPKLRTLIFKRNAFSRLIWRPPTEVPCCLLFHLKVIELHSVTGDSQLKLVGYFLENARVLERLKVQMRNGVEEKPEIAQKLLMLPRKSTMCQVEIV